MLFNNFMIMWNGTIQGHRQYKKPVNPPDRVNGKVFIKASSSKDSLPPSFESFPSRSSRPQRIDQRSLDNFDSSSQHFGSGFSPLSFEQQRRITIENAATSRRHSARQLDAYRSEDSHHYNRVSHFPRQYCPTTSRMNLDDNQNPVYDEALQFVSSSGSLTHPEMETKKEIYAEFVSEHFKCPVCLDVLLEATALNCGHRFCRYCIETWQKIKPSCPVCEEPVSLCMKQFDVDNAIDSVANLMSDEWKARRMMLAIFRQKTNETALATMSFPFQDAFAYLARKGKRITMKCFKFVKRTVRYTIVKSFRALEWMWENVGLEDLAKWIPILCLTVLLIYFGDQIVTFIQFMYYALLRFKRNVPVRDQIVGIFGEENLVKESRYQKFTTLPDGTFAKFLGLFYFNDAT